MKHTVNETKEYVDRGSKIRERRLIEGEKNILVKTNSTITPAEKDDKTTELCKAAFSSTQGVMKKTSVEQLDEIIQRIQGSFQSRSKSIKAMKDKMKRLTGDTDQTSQSSTPTARCIDNGKMGQANKINPVSSAFKTASAMEKV
ncbi:hypothetical protein BGZ95_009268 [Linnemannia exigua]|uniref:Uncharacterized protein n=1 Tax=Linnemannia exigua TaxID=604196 RepID=A0AAD4H782_9FUNG|nr:hypothetical protein BGZ95_009268 [Linnemannia exigua]